MPVAPLTLNASLQVSPRSAGYVTAGPCRRVLPVPRCPVRELFILPAAQTPTSGARNHSGANSATWPDGNERGLFCFQTRDFEVFCIK